MSLKVISVVFVKRKLKKGLFQSFVQSRRTPILLRKLILKPADNVSVELNIFILEIIFLFKAKNF